MKVLEVKNNLVKISYTPADSLLLSGFVIIEDSQCPYVAQVLSLKADNGTNYAIVKLLFTFDDEGIVKNYDGTIPSLDSDVTKLSSDELLDILPVNNPIEIGLLANQDVDLKVDRSIFEQNLLICSENRENTNILLENFVFQLASDNHKSIVFDIDGKMNGQKLKFGEDFKLPLNYDTINFIYEHDLDNVEPASKALIQDIFLEVQEYSKTVLDKFIPFDTFINVVDQQYKETGLTELVLLKNKLLKYKEENVFAQNAKEIHSLRSAIRANLTNILDISSANDTLQNEIIKYVYDAIDEMDLFVYSFVQITNDNADKKLIRHFLTKDKIYTSIVCSHNFKYLYELKERANNLILFVPQTIQHDFATYNTFLNKLNTDEFIIYGKSTQQVPLIIELSSLLEQPEEEEEPQQETEQDAPEEQEVPEEEKVDEPDDFSEESNSYSYETLMTDDVTTPQPEEAPEKEVPEEVVEEQPLEEENPEPEIEEPEQVEPEVIGNIIDEEIAAEEPQEVAAEIIEEPVQEPEQPEEEIYEEPAIEEGFPEQTFKPAQPLLEEIATLPEPSIFEEEPDVIDEVQVQQNLEEEEIVEEEPSPVSEVFTENFIESTEEPVIEEPTEPLPIISEPETEIIEEAQEEDFPPLDSPIKDNAAQVVDEIMFSQPQKAEPSIEEELEEETLTEDDLNFIEDVNIGTPEIAEEINVPVYPAETPVREDVQTFEQGDRVSHPKYGEGVVEKMIKYGNKTLCSINFVNIGRRLLDPAISEIEKVG